ncbi:O-antigen ligase family protein [Rossellomorea yichunensis]|uniref:O-antigen ligase family protein n=1 Tax=Rossellomorea yichunensis TaxID=3077331 RepID=UPI0028DE4EF9|nr:O-antigen ligase family protein [Rossellomorea sp. YC4-1]MDT9026821.1 hypothetical protein [Rossellomorea sp. YC4-1]
MFTLISVLIIFFKSDQGLLNKFLPAFIFTSAFYNLSVIFVFSFMELLLFLYIALGLIIILYKDYRINFYLLFLSTLSISFLIIGVLLSLNPFETFINILNLIVLIMVIFITSTLVGNIKQSFNIKNMINMYILVCISLSIGLIFQFSMHLFSIDFGQIFYYKDRIIFNLYFISKSTLSAFISSGAIIILIRLYKNLRLKYLLILLILLCGNIINTSRTGIVVMIVIFSLYVIFNTKYIFKNYKTSILILSVILVFSVSANLLLSSRTSSLFDDNGRFDLIIQSKEVLKDNFFLGIGSSWADLQEYGIFIELHNFVLQYLLQMGVIVIVSLILLLIYVGHKLKNSEFIYVFLFICLIGNFYTYWHNSLFINVLIILGILCARKNYKYL